MWSNLDAGSPSVVKQVEFFSISFSTALAVKLKKPRWHFKKRKLDFDLVGIGLRKT
jgi:hypothetical protein